MNYQIILIALALAMDCFAVSLSAGTILKQPKINQTITIGLYFGLFQGMMTFIGYFLGKYFEKFINSFDHWIAFGLLLIIGGKMIYESFEKNKKENFSMKHKVLLILAIATSIDAFGVGLSFAFLDYEILFSSLIIGLASFLLSIIGVYTGKFLQTVLGKKAELVGGLVLIGIGINILIG